MQKVFINSLPKSGTNLVAKSLELMGYKQSGGLGASLVFNGKMLSLLRSLYYKPVFSSGYMVGIDMPVELSRATVNRILNHANPHNFVTGHVGYTPELLNAIKERGFAPLLILRDPRAVLNSFIHYVTANNKHALYNFFKDKTINEQHHYALHGANIGKINLQPLRKRCEAMDAWISDADVLKLKFEDMVGSSGGGNDNTQEHSLSAIASFINADNINIHDISKNVFGAGRHTFRKGSIHSWQEEMPVSIQQEVNEVMHDVLISWGYETDS